METLVKKFKYVSNKKKINKITMQRLILKSWICLTLSKATGMLRKHNVS